MSSYKYQFDGHNASGFDNYIVLNSLPESHTSVKKIKTSRALIRLSFRAGSVYEDGREIPKYAKFVCSNFCHITGSLKDIQKQNNLQPKLLKGEIAQDLITLSDYKEYDSQWKPYLTDGNLGLANVVSKHGISIPKITDVSYKNSLTESSLGWVCLGRYLDEDKKIFYRPKNK